MDLNLDAMSESDLYAFVATVRGTRPRTAARKLFPGMPKGAVTATRDLHHYAWNKIAAMSCRLRGDINAALMYEGICDRIYSQLPEYARW